MKFGVVIHKPTMNLGDALLGKVPGAKKHGEEKNAKKEE